jgi:Secretion system C-terminal sorting domain/FG-GAP-like repeat
MKHLTLISFISLLAMILIAMPAHGQITFEEHTVDAAFLGAQDVCTADVDNDGDEDIFAAGYFADQVRCYENDGMGGWIMHIVDNNSVGPWYLFPTDMDQDGDVDLLCCAFFEDVISWYENIGNHQWVERFVSGSIDGPECACTVDMDYDGDLDIVGAAYNGDYINWWENDGNQVWTEHSVGGFYDGACYLEAADFDNDSDIDIFAALRHANKLVLLVNDGLFSFTQLDIDDNYPGARCIRAVDLDLDGDLDVLGAAQDAGTVSWFENVNQLDWPEETITNSLAGAWFVEAADVDNDGDIDVVGSGYLDNTVAWWESDGMAVWTEHVITDTFAGASGIRTCDIDQDHDIDIIGAGYEANQVLLWEQLGNEPQIEITLSPHGEPVTVPRGAAFIYDFNIECHIDNVVSGYIWTEAILPNGNPYGPVFSIPILFAPNMTIQITQLHQFVPMQAPLGQYQWVLSAGVYPGFPYESDSFPFTVIDAPSASTNQGTTEWISLGHDQIQIAAEDISEETASNTIPVKYAITAASPNPFNPSTTLSVNLPEAAELNVSVYNVTGQQVAILADGQFNSGSHTLSFDASNLSGGMYFVHASAEGWSSVQKVVLMK